MMKTETKGNLGSAVSERPAEFSATVAQWNRVAEVLPPDGVVVDTISPGGQQQRLKRKGNLWFFPITTRPVN